MDLEQLKNRDYYLVIDKSGSMEEHDCPGGKSRWSTCQESTQAIANKLAEFDPDGITVVPFATNFKTYENTTPDKVKNVFQENSPMGATNLAPPLQWIFNHYLAEKKAGTTKQHGSIAVVITDGAPSDPEEVSKAIANFTKKLDNREEFGIEFLQIGKDASASAYLKRLDDHLTQEGAKLDIVNTKTMEDLENVGLTEALIASLTE